MKLPQCPEVCTYCRDGKHVMHVLNELGDLWAEETSVWANGKARRQLILGGYADDEFWLEDLLRIVGLEYERNKGDNKNHAGKTSG